MNTKDRICPGCGRDFLMRMGSTFILGTLELWNNNHLLTDMNVDKDGNPMLNCIMCGRTKLKKNTYEHKKL